MRDIKEKIKEYDRLTEILWTDLERAIDPGGMYADLGPRCFQDYQKVRIFLLEHYPCLQLDEFNLPFLNKPAKDMSKRELSKWKRSVTHMRGYLELVLEEKK